MAQTVISQCSCMNTYQDTTYGRGNRVYNPMKNPNQYRCTSCGNKKDVSQQAVKAQSTEEIKKKSK